jgi:hypothetical protein
VPWVSAATTRSVGGAMPGSGDDPDEAHDVARASTTRDIKERIAILGEKRPRTLPRDGGARQDVAAVVTVHVLSGSYAATAGASVFVSGPRSFCRTTPSGPTMNVMIPLAP